MKHALFNKDHLKNLCENYNLYPDKQYGQHFLIEDSPVKEMIKAGGLSKDEIALEIGPGFGPLTHALASKAKKVIAFEIEQKLKKYWEDERKKHKNLNIDIVWGDGIDKFKNMEGQLPDTYKFFSNLPYQITSYAIKTLLEAENKPDKIVVMVQKEVAERICSDPGDLSLLSVFVQFYGKPRIVKQVSREAFWPKPNVDSAVLSIEEVRDPGIDAGKFFKVVKSGFSHKRKLLSNNLSGQLGLDKQELEDHLLEIKGNKKVRAQKLSVEDWAELVTRLEI